MVTISKNIWTNPSFACMMLANHNSIEYRSFVTWTILHCLSLVGCWASWNMFLFIWTLWMIHDYLKIDFKADCFIKYSIPGVQNWFNFENPSQLVPSIENWKYLPNLRIWSQRQAVKTESIYWTWVFDHIEHQKVSTMKNQGERKSSTCLWFGAAEKERPGAPKTIIIWVPTVIFGAPLRLLSCGFL